MNHQLDSPVVDQIPHSGSAENGRARVAADDSGYYVSVFVLSTSVLQIYLLQVGSTYLPFALIAVYMTAAYLILEARPTVDRFFLLFISLFCVEAVSVIWSPDRLSGVRDIVFGLPFLLSFLLGKTLYQKSPRRAVDVIRLYSFVGLFQSCLVILFRLFPLLESHFLRSGVASLLINPNSLHDFFNGLANNVNAPDKAGGLLLNANVAGVWCAVMAFITLTIPLLSGRRRERAIWSSVALVHACAVLACGSKAAVGLLILAPTLAWLILRFYRFKSVVLRFMLMFAVALFGILVLWLSKLWLAQTGFGQELLVTSIRRLAIWEFAWVKFRTSPWLGLGYGGWEREFASYGQQLSAFGLSPTLPPHNALIILWSQSGVIAAVLGGLIIAWILRITISVTSRSSRSRALALLSCSAVIFFYIQSMGENFGILGEVHVQAPLAFFIGIVAAYSKKSEDFR